MNLRFIRSFVVLAEEKSFTRAALRLNLAQPALSQQIQKLESELNFPLVRRDTRPLSLTEAGRHFLPDAKEIITKFDFAVRSAANAHKEKNQTIRIGFTRSSMYSFLPGFIRDFSANNPDIDLSLVEAIGEQQFELIRAGAVDIGIARDVDHAAGFRYVNMIEEPLRVILPNGHSLGERQWVTWADLADERFILFPNHPAARFPRKIVGLCEASGYKPDIAYMVSEIQTAIGLVSAGLGISVIAESTAMHVYGICSLPFARMDANGFTTSLVAIHLDAAPSAVVRDTLDAMINYTKSYQSAMFDGRKPE